MIIEAVIYGPTPSIAMDRFESPPPENISSKFKNWFWLKKFCRFEAFTPGIGIWVRTRVKSKIPSVIKILLRRLVFFQIDISLFIGLVYSIPNTVSRKAARAEVLANRAHRVRNKDLLLVQPS